MGDEARSQKCVGFVCSVDRGGLGLDDAVGIRETYAEEAKAARPMRRVVNCMAM